MEINLKGIPRRSFLYALGIALLLLLPSAGEPVGGPSSSGLKKELLFHLDQIPSRKERRHWSASFMEEMLRRW
jgi:hypothetical protein